MLGGGDRTSLAGARGLEPECRNQKNRSHVDRSLFAIQPAVNDFNFQAAATYLAHGPSAASEERSYGSFSRAIPLPFDPDPAKVEAKFDKGVLRIKLPKSAEVAKKQQKIEIKKA